MKAKAPAQTAVEIAVVAVAANARRKAPEAQATAAVVAMVQVMDRATAHAMHPAARHATPVSPVTTTAQAATKTNPHVRTTPTRHARAWDLTVCRASPAKPACPAHPAASLTRCAPAWT